MPTDATALEHVGMALDAYGDALHPLLGAAHEVRSALPACAKQEQHVLRATSEAAERGESALQAVEQAERAEAKWQAMHDTVGLKVEEIRNRVAAARRAVEDGERAGRDAQDSLESAIAECAAAGQRARDGENTLEERREMRRNAIEKLRAFAARGLVSAAGAALDVPDSAVVWGIDVALTLARRAEQALQTLKCGDEEWERIQSQVAQDYTELSRNLGALGYQAHADTTDQGMVVLVFYRNRAERPDRVAELVAEEIAVRRELLTGRERELLENHLQAEVASKLQRMLRDADTHVAAINAELDKRPTSTGVRFRLIWEPLPEDNEEVPVGLEAARRRLLNIRSEAWSAQDRTVVGEMLHSRIAAERARAESVGGSLLEPIFLS